jgi:hypothetical protein
MGVRPARYETMLPRKGIALLYEWAVVRRAQVRRGHFPSAHAVGGCAGGRRALDGDGSSRETFELVTVGPLFYSPHPHGTTVHHVL